MAVEPTVDQLRVIEQFVAAINDLVLEMDGVKRVWYEPLQVGPLGGRSAQVMGYYDLGDRIEPFAINVYSDANIALAAEGKLADEEDQRELRRRLDDA